MVWKGLHNYSKFMSDFEGAERRQNIVKCFRRHRRSMAQGDLLRMEF